ncbi:MAG: hypothetical protein ACO3DD_03740, partial [Burkholderiaceae bacterium]
MSDISHELDGMLQGVDRLLHARDQLKQPDVYAEDAVPIGSVRPEFFTQWMAVLGASSLGPPGAGGIQEAAMRSLRHHLQTRAISLRVATGQRLTVSPLWARLVQALPAGLDWHASEDSDWLCLGHSLHTAVALPGCNTTEQSLAALRKMAGPVGQTLCWLPENSRVRGFRLPRFPEVGYCISAEYQGRWAGQWSECGDPAVFFWLSSPETGPHGPLGLAMLAEKRVVVIVDRFPREPT